MSATRYQYPMARRYPKCQSEGKNAPNNYLCTDIKRHKWKWIGRIPSHTAIPRQDDDSIAIAALDWNSEGSRKQGRLAQTWRRSVNEEAKMTELP